MLSHEYLYGEDTEITPIPEYVVMRKVETLEEHLTELLEVSPKLRDSQRVTKVANAIEFWKNVNNTEDV